MPKVVVLHFRPACACTTHFPRNTKWSWEPLRPCTFTDTHHTILFWVQNPSLFSHWLGGFVTVVLKNPFQSSLPYSPAHCACLADVCVAWIAGLALSTLAHTHPTKSTTWPTTNTAIIIFIEQFLGASSVTKYQPRCWEDLASRSHELWGLV